MDVDEDSGQNFVSIGFIFCPAGHGFILFFENTVVVNLIKTCSSMTRMKGDF